MPSVRTTSCASTSWKLNQYRSRQLGSLVATIECGSDVWWVKNSSAPDRCTVSPRCSADSVRRLEAGAQQALVDLLTRKRRQRVGPDLPLRRHREVRQPGAQEVVELRAGDARPLAPPHDSDELL